MGQVRTGKGKRGSVWVGFWPKEVMGQLEAHRLGLAPSRAGSSPPWAGPSSFFSSLGWAFSSSRAGCVCSSFPLTDSVVPHVGLRGIQCGGVWIRCADGCERVRVGAVAPRCVCECEHPEGARGKAPTTWPRRERVVAAASRGWACTARLRRASPGFPGPRRGRAVRGAPASRARGTTRRRRGDGGSGEKGGASGSCKKRWHGGRKGKVVLWLATVGSSAALGSRWQHGGKRGTAAAILTGGAEGERGWCGGGSKPVGRSRAGRTAALVKTIGAPAQWSSGVVAVSSSGTPPPPPSLSHSRVRRRWKRARARVARVLGRRPVGS
jgi:hypothetical protein